MTPNRKRDPTHGVAVKYKTTAVPDRAFKYMKYTLKYTEIQLGRVQSQIHQIYAPNTCMNTATLPIDRLEKKLGIPLR
jgi:hypothetical protein